MGGLCSKPSEEAMAEAEDLTNPFQTDKVAGISAHGRQPDIHGHAVAKVNQDRGVIYSPVNKDPDQAIFAVYDGHGFQGEKVSQAVAENITRLVEKKIATGEDLHDNLTSTYLEVDDLLTKAKNYNSMGSGTTAVTMVMQGTKLTIANAGDSRAVLGTMDKGVLVHKDLSKDHKPDDPPEQLRIVRAGGYVSPQNFNFHRGPARVWFSDRGGGWGDGPGLAMSRSLGDHSVKKCGVIATPDIVVHDMTKSDKFIIIASDGIWEFIESKEAVKMTSKHKSAHDAARELTQEAMKRWRKEEGTYRDDITCIVIFLPCLDVMPPTARGGMAPVAAVFQPSDTMENLDDAGQSAEAELKSMSEEEVKDRRAKFKRRLTVGGDDGSWDAKDKV